jgi:hypothetical protein
MNVQSFHPRFTASNANAPEAAILATARLHCLGSRVTLRPVWESSAWPGESIHYRSGDLRIGRTAQIVLASFGRIEHEARPTPG